MLRCARDTRAQQNAFTIARAECFAKQGCSRCLFSSCSVLLSRAKSGDPRDAARADFPFTSRRLRATARRQVVAGRLSFPRDFQENTGKNRAAGGRAWSTSCDVTREGSVHALGETAREHLGSIDISKEWDAVLLPGLVEGLMPIVHARTAEAVEEERRLLYVAVTRAREHLYLSWASARAAGGRSGRQRSRFLDGVRLGK